MRRHALLISLCLAAMLPLAGHAASTDVFNLTASSTEEFRKQADQLRADMGPGGKYATLSAEDQAKVAKQLDVLQGLYNDRAERKNFGGADEIRLVNASEEINGVLLGDSDSRMICEQVRKLGSNRTQKVCMTAGDRRDAREASKQNLRDRQVGKATY